MTKTELYATALSIKISHEVIRICKLYLSNYYIRMFIKPRQSTHIHHMGNSRHITNHRVYILIWADNDVHAKMFDYHCESCASLTDDDNNVLEMNEGVFLINDLYKSFVTFACTVL